MTPILLFLYLCAAAAGIPLIGLALCITLGGIVRVIRQQCVLPVPHQGRSRGGAR